jgi:hypothetical protein
MSGLHRSILTAAVSVGLVAGAAAPSSAVVLDRFDLSESFSGPLTNFCGVSGLTADFTFDLTGTARVVQRGPSEFEFYHENTRLVRTFTHHGMTITEYVGAIAKDLSIVDNGDGTLSITLLSTGGARVVGHEGKVIAKNDGQVRTLLLVNATTGQVISEELVFGSTGTNDDFCDAVLADWGVTP